jgi:hypothetical protein
MGQRSYQILNYLLLAFLVLILLFPFYSEIVPSCPLKTHDGSPCPSCGLTSSWLNLYALDLEKAIAANPYGPSLFLFFFLQFITRLLIIQLKPHRHTPLIDTTLTLCLSIILVGPYCIHFHQWLMQNLNIS